MQGFFPTEKVNYARTLRGFDGRIVSHEFLNVTGGVSQASAAFNNGAKVLGDELVSDVGTAAVLKAHLGEDVVQHSLNIAVFIASDDRSAAIGDEVHLTEAVNDLVYFAVQHNFAVLKLTIAVGVEAHAVAAVAGLEHDVGTGNAIIILQNGVFFAIFAEESKRIAAPLVVNAEGCGNLRILVRLHNRTPNLEADGLAQFARSNCILTGIILMGGAIRVTDIDLNFLKVFGFDCEQALTSLDAILNVFAEILFLGDFNFGIRMNLHAGHDGVGFLQLVVRAAIPDKAGFFNGQRGDVQTEVFELVGGNRVIPASRERGSRDREDHDESDCESQNLLHFFVSLSTVFLQVSRERFPRQ